MTLLGNTHTLHSTSPTWLIRQMQNSEQHAAWMISQTAFTSPDSDNSTSLAILDYLWNSWGKEWFQWLHEQGHGWSALDPSDGKLVGYARVLRSVEQRVEILTECYVHPAFQHQKAGSQLLAAALSPQVPDGWQRMILSTDQPNAIGMYLRLGVLPAGTIWMIAPDLSQHAIHFPQQLSIRRIDEMNPVIMSAMDRLDMLTFGWQHTAINVLMQTTLHAQLFVSERNGAITGYALRHNGMIGPAASANSDDLVALIQAHLADMQSQQEPLAGLWIHHTNSPLISWLTSQHIPIHILSQGVLLASSPSIPRLENIVFTTPPFVP